MFNNLYGFSKSNLMNLEEEEELNSNLYNNININEQYNDVIIPKENLFNPLLNNSHIEIKSNSNYEKDKKKMIFYTKKNYQSKKRRIFKIEKIEKMKKKFIKRKINLDNVNIPKVKHLNVEKKKNRIQYQENHKKTIYSYCHLTPPYDFEKLFELIIEHQNLNNKNFTTKKSFHFIRKIDKNICIVTFKEKQRIMKIGY